MCGHVIMFPWILHNLLSQQYFCLFRSADSAKIRRPSKSTASACTVHFVSQLVLLLLVFFNFAYSAVLKDPMTTTRKRW